MGVQVTISASQIDKQRLGYQAVSLTHYADTAEPSIAEGSKVEIGGALYEFTVDEAGTGWAGIGVSTWAYILLTPSGATVSWSYTEVAPAWSTSKQGWYTGNNRVIGGLYKDASSNYTEKYLLAGWNEQVVDTDKLRNLAVTVSKLAVNAVTEAKIDKAFGTGGSQAVAASGYWTPAAGLYMWIGTGAAGWYVEIYQGAAWRTSYMDVCGGFLLADGTNVRVKNADTSSRTLYYLNMA